MLALSSLAAVGLGVSSYLVVAAVVAMPIFSSALTLATVGLSKLRPLGGIQLLATISLAYLAWLDFYLTFD